jgi:hypothetical protein
MIKEYPAIINTYKGKVEYARKLKRDKGLPDDLTREDVEPILNNALNMVRSNVPASMKKPKNIQELAKMLKESGVAKMFGLRDNEIDMIGQIATEKLNTQPIVAPMPIAQSNQSGLRPQSRNITLGSFEGGMLGGMINGW